MQCWMETKSRTPSAMPLLCCAARSARRAAKRKCTSTRRQAVWSARSRVVHEVKVVPTCKTGVGHFKNILFLSCASGTWSDFCDWIKQSKMSKHKSPAPALLSSSASVVEAARRTEEVKSCWSASKPWASCSSSLQEQVRRVFGIEVRWQYHAWRHSDAVLSSCTRKLCAVGI